MTPFSAPAPQPVARRRLCPLVLGIALAAMAGSACTTVDDLTQPSCTYASTATPAAFEAAGGTGSVAITAAGVCGWQLKSDAAWLTLSENTAGEGDGRVSFVVAANSGHAPRTARVTGAGPATSITQAAAACTYAVTPTSAEFGAAGGTEAIEVGTDADCAWTASADAAWVVIANRGSGSGPGRVEYRVDPNDDTHSRTATLSIGGRTVRIEQAGSAPPPTAPAPGPAPTPKPAPAPAPPPPAPEPAPNPPPPPPELCTYTVTPSTVAATDAGGPASVTVDATGLACAWTATSNTTWIAITAGGIGLNDGTVSFTVARNEATSGRTGSLTVAGRTVSVTQAGIPCSYALSPAGVHIDHDARRDHIDVTATAGCAWTAKSSDGWLTVDPPGSGTGSGRVNYSVKDNKSKDARTATITIGTAVFTVVQDADGKK